MAIETITQEGKEVFEYLNVLRDSGVTNMFGAAPYIQRKFGIQKNAAREHLQNWMVHYNPKGYSHLTVVNP